MNRFLSVTEAVQLYRLCCVLKKGYERRNKNLPLADLMMRYLENNYHDLMQKFNDAFDSVENGFEVEGGQSNMISSDLEVFYYYGSCREKFNELKHDGKVSEAAEYRKKISEDFMSDWRTSAHCAIRILEGGYSVDHIKQAQDIVDAMDYSLLAVSLPILFLSVEDIEKLSNYVDSLRFMLGFEKECAEK